MYAVVHVWRSEDSVWEPLSPSTIWVQAWEQVPLFSEPSCWISFVNIYNMLKQPRNVFETRPYYASLASLELIM